VGGIPCLKSSYISRRPNCAFLHNWRVSFFDSRQGGRVRLRHRLWNRRREHRKKTRQRRSAAPPMATFFAVLISIVLLLPAVAPEGFLTGQLEGCVALELLQTPCVLYDVVCAGDRARVSQACVDQLSMLDGVVLPMLLA
jgi:hypothetical protein